MYLFLLPEEEIRPEVFCIEIMRFKIKQCLIKIYVKMHVKILCEREKNIESLFLIGTSFRLLLKKLYLNLSY